MEKIEHIDLVEGAIQTKSSCYMCYNSCGIIAHTKDNKVLKVEGDPDNPQNYGQMCVKGRSGPQGLDNPNRITTPLRRTNPEKGIGVDPKWAPISWEQALTEVTDKLVKLRADDPRKLIGCTFDVTAYMPFFGWLNAFGSPNGVAGGADFFCGNGTHPIAELTCGCWFLEPDVENCNYLILDGTQAGFVTHHLPMHMADAVSRGRKRGMKLVVIDPICTNAAKSADEWIPIKPGTDGAFSLAMSNVLVNELGIYDAPYLKAQTNAPYLVGNDGRYVRDGETNKPLVWDEQQGKAVAFNTVKSEVMAITGEYEVAGKTCAPSFQKIIDHLKDYSPEMASKITGIPAQTIRRIAKEFGEAASIGATKEVDGETLPYRPACINWYRGPTSHSHGFMTGFSLQLINMIIGAVDVPGGLLGSNPVGPWWGPDVSEDGMILPNNYPLANMGDFPYPGRPAKMPETVTLLELFPVAPYSGSMMYEGMIDPEKYGLPYKPEMLMICRSNPIMTTINPGVVEEALKKLKCIVAFAFTADETTEFADYVFPDAHYFERYDGFTNAPSNFHAAGEGDWHFQIRQPVVEPPEGVTHWMDVMFDLAVRVGFKEALYERMNHFLPLTEAYFLDPEKTYSWKDMIDVWLRSHFGEERNLDWFKQHGFINYRKKTVQEAYPRVFLESRIPVYLEHLLGFKDGVKEVTEKLGIPWDVSDYQPIPDWRPCEAHSIEDGYDLFAVNCKVPFHTFTSTVGNPILNDVQESPHIKQGKHILINTLTARAKGLSDNDEIWVETNHGVRVKGLVTVTNGIQVDSVGFPGIWGRWARNLSEKAYGGPHFNALLPRSVERIDKLAATTDMCVKAKIYPVEK